jgi:hypothetical protein
MIDTLRRHGYEFVTVGEVARLTAAGAPKRVPLSAS